MPTKTKIKKKFKRPSKRILFLHVSYNTKQWFGAITRRAGTTSDLGRVNQSTVAERILSNLRKQPSLLKAALR